MNTKETKYFFKIVREKKTFSVFFTDVPEAITFATKFKDAIKNAADALETALSFYMSDDDKLPISVYRGKYSIRIKTKKFIKNL